MTWTPTVKQTKSLLDYSENSRTYTTNINELRSSYAGQYIAISKQQVILSKSTPEELIHELNKIYKSSERSSVFIAYVPEANEVMIA